jgi:hypothetical protein
MQKAYPAPAPFVAGLVENARPLPRCVRVEELAPGVELARGQPLRVEADSLEHWLDLCA